MTASPPQMNGHKRPTMPVIGDWRPVTGPEPVEEQRTPEPAPAVKPDTIAEAEAAAIRARSYAEAEALRITAEAEAEAAKIKAVEEARKLKLANDRGEARFEEEQAARAARIAKSNKDRADAERAEAAAAEQDEADKKAREEAAGEIAVADDRWRKYALNFYRVCAIVALPVQLNAFYDRDALWLMAAPLMLEGGAWVVQKGAASAVAHGRPAWHYRVIAWLLAFIAAAINLWHGLNAFDAATAIGTAFASIAGPGVWDLHEHGRIRRRDGVLTRRERKAQESSAKAAAKREAAETARHQAEAKTAQEAAVAAAEKLAADRELKFPKVWEHALKLAADLGQAAVNEAVWTQAKLDVEGAKPGESADVIRMRNAAQARVEAAREKRPVNGSSAQAASQVLPSHGPRVYNPPVRRGKRARGDTPKFVSAARKQASLAARDARQKEL